MKNRKFSENITQTAIPGLLIIERPTFEDGRGFFREVARVSELEDATGVKFNFKQWSYSKSMPGVIRALHSEDQNKIVYPLTGESFSAYVDLREDSATFGKVETVTYKPPNYKAVFIPKGVANSICVTGNEPVYYMYLIDEYYDPKRIKGIAWDDPDLAIAWPIKNPMISDRDKNNLSLRAAFPEKFKQKSINFISENQKKIYVTGSAGLVGSRFVEMYKDKFELLTPEINELDIIDRRALEDFFASEKPNFVVHFAAHTDLNQAEKEREDRQGAVWKINVEGTRNIAEMCWKYGVKMVHISTDHVFPGSVEEPGPNEEHTETGKYSDKLTWYGFTKAEAEREVRGKLGGNFAILRLIYPARAKYGLKADYLRNILQLYDQGKLYPMFSDQQVSITFIDEACAAIAKIIQGGHAGIFHASSSDVGTPYRIASYLIKNARGKKNSVERASLDKFLETVDNPARYPKFGGLRVKATEERLGLKYSTWREIVNKLIAQGIT